MVWNTVDKDIPQLELQALATLKKLGEET